MGNSLHSHKENGNDHRSTSSDKRPYVKGNSVAVKTSGDSRSRHSIKSAKKDKGASPTYVLAQHVSSLSNVSHSAEVSVPSADDAAPLTRPTSPGMHVSAKSTLETSKPHQQIKHQQLQEEQRNKRKQRRHDQEELYQQYHHRDHGLPVVNLVETRPLPENQFKSSFRRQDPKTGPPGTIKTVYVLSHPGTTYPYYDSDRTIYFQDQMSPGSELNSFDPARARRLDPRRVMSQQSLNYHQQRSSTLPRPAVHSQATQTPLPTKTILAPIAAESSGTLNRHRGGIPGATESNQWRSKSSHVLSASSATVASMATNQDRRNRFSGEEDEDEIDESESSSGLYVRWSPKFQYRRTLQFHELSRIPVMTNTASPPIDRQVFVRGQPTMYREPYIPNRGGPYEIQVPVLLSHSLSNLQQQDSIRGSSYRGTTRSRNFQSSSLINIDKQQ